MKRFSQMTEWQRRHWMRLYVLSLFVGIGFVFVGGIFVIWGMSLVGNPKATIDVNGVPTSDFWEKSQILIVGLMACVIGVLLFVARKLMLKRLRD